MEEKIVIFWFRRDLRLNDNPGLHAALTSGLPVLPVFIFDTKILSSLPAGKDARLLFIYRELSGIKEQLEKSGTSLLFFHGTPEDAFNNFTRLFSIHTVFSNRDYEPYGKDRDENVRKLLEKKGILFKTFKDHVIFEKDEVLKEDGSPYTVFTPYAGKWKKLLNPENLRHYPSESELDNCLKTKPFPLLSLKETGFQDFDFKFPGKRVSDDLLANYGNTRDYPAIEGTSRLGIHLRFGTVSIRELTRRTFKQAPVFLNELIWRNFFIDILAHFPYVADGPFKKRYNHISWRNNEHEFERWCRGETGFPIVDAGMRELDETGFMHNRIRMIAASFLTKQLLIDWRWGEAWFAGKLLDFELASNNGNWQWVAGCGCDAVPYFRIFNPELQQKKFDPMGEYVKKWIPEAGKPVYPQPVVDHSCARERAVSAYKKGLSE